jgi:hypothetical protein
MAQKIKITTIKLSEETKKRLDVLKAFKKESYDEVLQKIFHILSLCRSSPDAARSRLIGIDRQKRLYQNPSKSEINLAKQEAKQPQQAKSSSIL